MSLIYKATCILNNKCYIGYTTDLEKRKKKHKQASFTISSPSYNSLFQKAIRKYGWDSFTWEILFESEDSMYCLKEMEPKFINEHKSFYTKHGYNMTYGGRGGKPKGVSPWNKGLNKSDPRVSAYGSKTRETRMKTGSYVCSPEVKEKIRETSKKVAFKRKRDSWSRFVKES